MRNGTVINFTIVMRMFDMKWRILHAQPKNQSTHSISRIPLNRALAFKALRPTLSDVEIALRYLTVFFSGPF